MTDDEFLDYCSARTEIERCGIVPAHIVRLFRLAGKEEQAKIWAEEPNYIVSGCHEAIWNLVAEARSRQRTEAAK
jgi:hypothetical protein